MGSTGKQKTRRLGRVALHSHVRKFTRANYLFALKSKLFNTTERISSLIVTSQLKSIGDGLTKIHELLVLLTTGYRLATIGDATAGEDHSLANGSFYVAPSTGKCPADRYPTRYDSTTKTPSCHLEPTFFLVCLPPGLKSQPAPNTFKPLSTKNAHVLRGRRITQVVEIPEKPKS